MPYLLLHGKTLKLWLFHENYTLKMLMDFILTGIEPDVTEVTVESVEEDSKVHHWNCSVNTELNECTSAVCGSGSQLDISLRIPQRVYNCSLKFVCKLIFKFKKSF